MENEKWFNWTSDLESFISNLSHDQREELLMLLSRGKEQNKKNYWEPIPELVWDYEKVLKYICDNCVEHRKWHEYWTDWEIITVSLPAVWTFEWFNFSCFRSSEFKYWDYVNCHYDSISYSVEEICQLLHKITEFLYAYWVDDLSYYKNSSVPRKRCSEYLHWWDVLYEILECSWAWLKDNMPPCGQAVLRRKWWYSMWFEIKSGWSHITTTWSSENGKLHGTEITKSYRSESTHSDKYNCLLKM